MNVKDKIKDAVERNLTIKRLVTIALTLIIVFLLIQTQGVWIWGYHKAKAILLPFIIGFGIAFLLHPIANYFEKFGLKRQYVVPIVLVLFVVLVTMLFMSFMPRLTTDITRIISSSIEGIQKLYEYYADISNGNPEPWVQEVVNEATKFIRDLITRIPTLSGIASQFIGSFVGFLATTLFSLVLGLYFIFDYEKFTHNVLRIANRVSTKFGNSLIVINRAVLQYLRSLIVLMVIRFVEYTILFGVMGHNYAVVLGVLSALGMLVPFVGPISVQILGLLTSLNLPFGRVIFLTVGLVILSNVDNYLISPMVYSKRDKVEPISSLFIFFASSILFGFIGILLSMPIYFSIRAIMDLRENNWELEEKIELLEENVEVSEKRFDDEA